MNAKRAATADKWACLQLMAEGRVDERLRLLDYARLGRLLHWLDVSGLALHFLRECDSRDLTQQVSPSLIAHLRERAKRNRLRIDIQLEQLRRVSEVLETANIPFAVRKGFALTPAFCADHHLRHQVDIDLVIDEVNASRAVATLAPLGYYTDHIDNGEYLLLADSTSAPPAPEDIYAIREHRIELHSVLWDALAGSVSPQARLSQIRLENHRVGGIDFAVLPLELTAVGQLLHAVKHLQAGWLRLSWLWELHWFITQTSPREEFWKEVLTLAQLSRAQERGVATVFLLLQRTFGTELPAAVGPLAKDAPASIRSWTNGRCDEFLFRERPDDHSPIFLSLTGTAASLKLGRTALIERLRQPLRYFVASGKRTLRDDLHRAWTLFAWRWAR
jgi:hypothetical protein